jgi:hypothetical protein
MASVPCHKCNSEAPAFLIARVHVIQIKGLLRQPLFWFSNQYGFDANVFKTESRGMHKSPHPDPLPQGEREKSDLFLEVIVARVSAGKLKA